MNHEYLHIILTNVFRYDLHQSVNQMIRWSENVFFDFILLFFGYEVLYFFLGEEEKSVKSL